FKAKAVAAALEPGVNVSALARRLGISPPQLFGWRKTFLNKEKEDVPAGSPASVVEIVVGDVVIRVSPDLEEAALRRILRRCARHDAFWCEGLSGGPTGRLPKGA
ncbi:MAG: transposase, partial [Paracoccaceae bacterium]|nr:transposase [Paracoccaceae bacterium]